MWKIFISKHSDSEELLTAIKDWADSVFAKMDVKLKQYFAESVVINFDNMMLFNHKKKVIEHLQESVAQSLISMNLYKTLFPEIKSYLLKQEDKYYLIVQGLPDEDKYYPTDYGFKLIDKDAKPDITQFKKFERLSFSHLVYDIELSDVEKGWINYTPPIEKRSFLQAQHIMMSLFEKEQVENLCMDNSLTEKLKYEKDIHSHPQFKNLHKKLEKVLPKIETSMEFAWREFIIQKNKSHKPVMS